jgi:hypothetical protein
MMRNIINVSFTEQEVKQVLISIYGIVPHRHFSRGSKSGVWNLLILTYFGFVIKILSVFHGVINFDKNLRPLHCLKSLATRYEFKKNYLFASYNLIFDTRVLYLMDRIRLFLLPILSAVELTIKCVTDPLVTFAENTFLFYFRYMQIFGINLHWNVFK